VTRGQLPQRAGSLGLTAVGLTPRYPQLYSEDCICELCVCGNSSAEECQSWINTLNYVAASLSAPPLPGAVGSQRKFQRPLMPCSYTKLSLVSGIFLPVENQYDR